MSPPQLAQEPPRGWRWRRAAVRPTALVWLTLVWVGLWGELSLANVLVGLLLAVVVCLVFPLPRVPVRLRPRPHLLVWLLVRFLVDVLVASIQVIRVVLKPAGLRNAVVAVDLSSDSDLVLTIVAEMTSLVPGSLVVEVRRSTQTLFIHVLDASGPEVLEAMRRETLALDRRVIRALGLQRPASASKATSTPRRGAS